MSYLEHRGIRQHLLVSAIVLYETQFTIRLLQRRNEQWGNITATFTDVKERSGKGLPNYKRKNGRGLPNLHIKQMNFDRCITI